jgi:hypothetical protein
VTKGRRNWSAHSWALPTHSLTHSHARKHTGRFWGQTLNHGPAAVRPRPNVDVRAPKSGIPPPEESLALVGGAPLSRVEPLQPQPTANRILRAGSILRPVPVILQQLSAANHRLQHSRLARQPLATCHCSLTSHSPSRPFSTRTRQRANTGHAFSFSCCVSEQQLDLLD